MKTLFTTLLCLLAVTGLAATYPNSATTNAVPTVAGTNIIGNLLITGNAAGTGSLTFSNTVYSGLFAVTNFVDGAAQSSTTNDTAEKTIATWTIPGGAIGSNGAVRVSAWMQGYGGVTNIRTYVYFGATKVADFFQASTTAVLSDMQRTVRNRNNQASQMGGVGASANPYGYSGSLPPYKTTFDTSTNFTLSVTSQHSGLGQTNQVVSLLIEILGHQ